MPHILQGGKEVPLAGKLHQSISVFLDLHYLADEPAAAEGKPGANLGFFARTADQLPQLIPFLLQQQKFNKGAIVYFLSVQASRNDTAVVEYQ